MTRVLIDMLKPPSGSGTGGLHLRDTANQIFRFLKQMWDGITNTAKRALQRLRAARVKLIAKLETAKNLCRGLRGLPKNLIVRPGAARIRIGSHAPEVRVSGAIEARVHRLKDEMSALPNRWQADMRRLREQLVEFRLSGILLILIGVVFVAAGQLLCFPLLERWILTGRSFFYP